VNNLTLYLASVVIWGSTWIAITFQYGPVAPEVSVAYRFWLATLMLLAWCLARGLRLRFSLREHAWMALQGVPIFGINYVCAYLAEQRVPSGLMATLYSLMVFSNLAGARVAFGTPLTARALAGSVLGVAGVTVIFLPGTGPALRPGMGLGLVLALVGVATASLGNLVSQRNQRAGLPVLQGNAFGMLYGAVAVTVYALAMGRPLAFDPSFRYLASLAYLALFGSVLAFGAYLTLIGRIGAGRAGYAMVAIPLVALLISTLFEGLRWRPALVLGVLLCLGGNVLVLARPRRPEPAGRS
jgi:drug/metabolite transporter (DMT)-like permease